jgi:hypothetical protein
MSLKKRKILTSIISFFLIAAMVLLTICSTGCGKKEEIAEEEVVEYIAGAEEEETEAANPITATKDELLSMSAKEIEEMITTHLPNWRSYFKIDDDKVMTDDDWYQVRDILCLQLYGSLISDEEEKEASEAETTEEFLESVGVDPEDPDWIYTAPTADYINSLSTEEFGAYLNGYYTYLQPDAEKLPDFTTLSDEDLEEARAMILQNIESVFAQ